MKPKTYNLRPKNSAFIALISSVIISAVLLVIVLSMTTKGFFARSNGIENQNKKISFVLAESCLDIAKLKLKQDVSYAGGEIIPQNLGSCAICPVQYSSGKIKVYTRSAVRDSYTNLQQVLYNGDLSAVSFEEISTYPSSDCPLH
jgi:hypothetical protein